MKNNMWNIKGQEREEDKKMVAGETRNNKLKSTNQNKKERINRKREYNSLQVRRNL